jgi:hypothetical protein
MFSLNRSDYSILNKQNINDTKVFNILSIDEVLKNKIKTLKKFLKENDFLLINFDNAHYRSWYQNREKRIYIQPFREWNSGVEQSKIEIKLNKDGFLEIFHGINETVESTFIFEKLNLFEHRILNQSLHALDFNESIIKEDSSYYSSSNGNLSSSNIIDQANELQDEHSELHKCIAAETIDVLQSKGTIAAIECLEIKISIFGYDAFLKGLNAFHEKREQVLTLLALTMKLTPHIINECNNSNEADKSARYYRFKSCLDDITSFFNETELNNLFNESIVFRNSNSLKSMIEGGYEISIHNIHYLLNANFCDDHLKKLLLNKLKK